MTKVQEEIQNERDAEKVRIPNMAYVVDSAHLVALWDEKFNRLGLNPAAELAKLALGHDEFLASWGLHCWDDINRFERFLINKNAEAHK